MTRSLYKRYKNTPLMMIKAQSTRRQADLAIRRMQRGYVRKGGFYGRFNTAKARAGGELKFFDTDLSFTFDSTGEVPATGQLNLIPQDATQSGRIGRTCTVKSIHIKGQVQYVPAASTNGCDSAFMYLVLDKQCNGAAAAATAVLDSTDFRVAMTNLENSDRFVILKKWIHNLNSSAGVSGAYGRYIKNMDFYKKCNIPLYFDSTAATGALTTIRSNNIFLLAGAGQEDDVTTFAGQCRLRFMDS